MFSYLCRIQIDHQEYQPHLINWDHVSPIPGTYGIMGKRRPYRKRNSRETDTEHQYRYTSVETDGNHEDNHQDTPGDDERKVLVRLTQKVKTCAFKLPLFHWNW